MARTSIATPETEAEGAVRFTGYDGPVRFLVRGEPTSLRRGPGALRGALLLEPELAQAAFRSGQGVLTLPTGQTYRLTFLGHTSGDDRTYFEMRI